MKPITALTATLITAAIGCAPAPTALGQAAVSSAPALSGHILYTTSAAGDVQTFWRTDRAGTVQLTEPGAYCCLHRISPDHRRLLVMPGDDSLLGSPPTGGTLTLRDLQYTRLRLTDPDLILIPQAWSPNGMQVAFEGWDESTPGRTGVYTARYPGGGDLTRVTTRPDMPHDIPLDYSPDGKQLVFYRAVRAEPDFPTDIGGSLWVVNVDGSNPHPITPDSVRPSWWARWSPDGHRILFASERVSSTGAVWTVEPDGSHLTKLFQDTDGRFPITPDWSPDGQHIVLALDPTNDQFQHPANGLYVIDADGGDLQLVIGGDDFKTDPEWYG